MKAYYNTHTGELKGATSKRGAIKYFKEDALLHDYYFEKGHIVRLYSKHYENIVRK